MRIKRRDGEKKERERKRWIDGRRIRRKVKRRRGEIGEGSHKKIEDRKESHKK